MSQLTTHLASRFDAAIVACFGASFAGTPAQLHRSNHADMQADVALGLAKKLGKPPRVVAEQLLAALQQTGLIERAEIAGPGFINLTIDRQWLAAQAARLLEDAKLGTETATAHTVVIDYSSPNVAKEMHVGHVRSTLIGDALGRILEFRGDRVVRQNHLGDWGTPFGMLIEHLVDTCGGDAEALDRVQGDHAIVQDLDAFYRQSRAKFDADPAFADRARQRVVLLQAGDERTLALWRTLVAISTSYFDRIYQRLGVKLKPEDVCGESFFNPMLPVVVRDLRAAGLLVESDGAECAFPDGFVNKEGSPLPLIVCKKDGGFGYAATDFAALRHRVSKLGAARILYVVGAPQQQHLAMVFAVAKAAGWLNASTDATHVAFGSILGPDKKMFKTREGGTVKLADLLDEAESRALAVIEAKNPPHLGPDERREVARMVGIGALKYVDLSSDRVKDYVFDWDRMLAFDGNTAPYLQFACARTRSILRKGSTEHARPGAIHIETPEERALALHVSGFSDAVSAVADTLQPHRLCTYLYELATTTTSFVENCPVLKAADEPTRASRLSLAALAAHALGTGLELLGIDAPQVM